MDIEKQLRRLLRWKPSRDDQFELFWQLYTYEKAGISTITAIHDLFNNERNPHLKEILKQIRQELNNGNSLADAFQKTDVFSHHIIASLHAGEKAGELDETYKRIAEYVEQEATVISKVHEAFYPVIYGSIGVIIAGYVLANVIVPRVEKMAANRHVELPGLVKGVFTIIHMIQDFWYLIIALLLAGIFTAKWFYAERPEVFDRWKFKTPLYRELYFYLTQYRFCQMLSLLDANGISPIVSLEYAGAVTENSIIKNTCLQASKLITLQGMSIARALEKSDSSHVLDARVLSFIRTGEKGGQISEILQELIGYYRRAIEKRTKKFANQTTLVAVVLVATIVACMYLTLFLAQSAMFKAISQ